ncbi:hypothetical protein [Saccharopolyspora tripterygii]
MSEKDFTRGFAGGDEAAARHLHDRFRIIQERSPDPTVRALAGRVVSGELGPREAMRAPAFANFLATSVQKGMQKVNSMSEDERKKHAERGEREFQEVGVEKSGEPAQEINDDDYFQQDSWLESVDGDQ